MARALFPILVCGGVAWSCASTARPAPQPARVLPAPTSLAAPGAAPGASATQSILEDALREDRHLSGVHQLTLDGHACVSPRPSPDGTVVAYALQPTPTAAWRVALVTHDGRPSGALALDGAHTLDPSWTADGTQLLVASTQRNPAGTPPDGLDVLLMSVTGTTALDVVTGPGMDAQPLALGGGEVLYVHQDPHGAETILVRQADGTSRPLTPGGAPALSPDGTRLVFRRLTSDGLTAELWEHPLPSGPERQLTALGALSWAPAFHPSGTKVIFASNARPNSRVPGDNFDLYVLDLRTARVERVTYADGPDSTPAFSPDGHVLYWTSARQGGRNQLFAATWMD